MADETITRGKAAKRRNAEGKIAPVRPKGEVRKAGERRDECVELVFGMNAGIIWDLLNLKGPMSARELAKAAALRTEDVHGALGWLGRENKICVCKQGRSRIYSLKQ